MTTSPDSVGSGCECIKSMDAMLLEHNARVVCTLGLFGTPQKVSLEVEKADEKKRGRPPRLIASFCPFCGTKYPVAKATATPSAMGSGDE